MPINRRGGPAHKAGQILSQQADLMPEEIRASLLQDNATLLTGDEAQRLLTICRALKERSKRYVNVSCAGRWPRCATFRQAGFVGELLSSSEDGGMGGTSQSALMIHSLLISEGAAKQRYPDLDF